MKRLWRFAGCSVGLAGFVGRTPSSTRDPLVAFCALPSQAARPPALRSVGLQPMADRGVGRGPGGSPHRAGALASVLMAMIAIAFVFAAALIGADPPADGPQYTKDGRLARPQNYREWIFLSSGLGMTYGPLASPGEPRFDNVFVNPAAYRAFLDTGRWPDQTVLVLEVRSAQSKGSINRGGHFQDEVVGVELHVKDEKRFPGKWAFFGFREGEQASTVIPTTAGCYSCHQQNGAVDTTFVQFYPTLIGPAKAKGTMK